MHAPTNTTADLFADAGLRLRTARMRRELARTVLAITQDLKRAGSLDPTHAAINASIGAALTDCRAAKAELRIEILRAEMVLYWHGTTRATRDAALARWWRGWDSARTRTHARTRT